MPYRDDARMPCIRCSKPIKRGTGQPLATGEWIHLRCQAQDLRLRSIETQAAASEKIRRARELASRSRSAIERARRRSECPVCHLPLSAGGGLLFQGDQLVHARCWQGPSEEPPAA